MGAGLSAGHADVQGVGIWNALVVLVYIFIGYGILKRQPRAYSWAVGSNILNAVFDGYRVFQGTAGVNVFLIPLEIAIPVILFLNRKQFETTDAASESKPVHQSFRLTTERSSRPRSRILVVGLLLGIMGIAASGCSSPSPASTNTVPASGAPATSILTQQIGQTTSQAPQPTATTNWTISTTTDKLTDVQVLTARVQAMSENGNRYELVMRCDGRTEGQENTIRTFTSSGDGRAIEWETFRIVVGSSRQDLGRQNYRTGDGIHQLLDTKMRFDAESVQNIRITPSQLGNVAEFGNLSRLPVERLVVADIFPNETVEFAFAALTAKQRDDVHHWCFEPMERATAAKKAEEDELRPFRDGLKVGDVVELDELGAQFRFQKVRVVRLNDTGTVGVVILHQGNYPYDCDRQALFPPDWGVTHQKS